MKNEIYELETDVLKSDLSVIGLVLVLMFVLYTYFDIEYNKHKYDKKIIDLSSRIIDTKSIAVDLHQENKELQAQIKELQEDLKDVKVLIKIKEELRNYSLEEKAIALGLGYTESSWRYDANHQGLYKNFCGNMPWHWDNYLRDKNVNTKGVAACVEIYKFYEDKYGSRYNAIKAYKGIVKNTYLINKTERMIDRAHKILKDNYKGL